MDQLLELRVLSIHFRSVYIDDLTDAIIAKNSPHQFLVQRRQNRVGWRGTHSVSSLHRNADAAKRITHTLYWRYRKYCEISRPESVVPSLKWAVSPSSIPSSTISIAVQSRQVAFRQRARIIGDYFESCRRHLAAVGVLVCNAIVGWRRGCSQYEPREFHQGG